MANNLPKFDNPPLDELVLGIQFEDLKELTPTHRHEIAGLFLGQFPSIEQMPPLPSRFEKFDEAE